MDIKENSSLWLTNVLTRNLDTLLLTREQALFLKIINCLINYTGPSLNNFKNEKDIHLFKITFGLLIL